MAVDGYCINGACFVYVGVGTAFTAQLLGYTENGVTMEVMENKSEIFTDVFGTMTPQDFQDMGATAVIRVPLIAMDRTVFKQVQMWGVAGVGPPVLPGRTSYGQINQPGMVTGVSGNYIKVGLVGAADEGWVFPTALVRPKTGTQLATKVHPFTVEFLAWPWASYTATTGKNTTLFSRVAAGSMPPW